MHKNDSGEILSPRAYDVILVGAGLANGILALFLRAKKPDLRLLVLESGVQLPMARTWCFHHSDISASQKEIIAPLTSATWESYEVRFPSFTQPKFIESAYSAIHPQTLQEILKRALGENLRFDCHVQKISPTQVQLTNGEVLSAPCIVDGRGYKGSIENCGYQKFVGLNLRLSEPHGLSSPILMDGTVPQLDGYRFMYVLPWNEHEVLIEDTRYSESAAIQPERYAEEILAYAKAKGFSVKEIVSREQGVLPLPLAPIESRTATIFEKAVKIGMAGAYFHPVTGYSLPDAVRIADLLSSLPNATSDAYALQLKRYREKHSTQWTYLCMLNRLMFLAAKPPERYRIFQRFYTLNEPLIQRFYRGQLRLGDKVRILMGSPPVPILPALKALRRSTL